MLTINRPPIPFVVQQHQEETACLRATRQFLVHAPHVRLHQLGRLDERIAAHLDGLSVAGDYGSRLCDAALASPGIGEVFAATVRAILDRHAPRLERLLSLAEAEPAAEAGLLSAFGWVSARGLHGITKELLVSRSAFQRQVGLAACGMHRVDPGAALAAALIDPTALLRRRALRVAGELGRIDLLTSCLEAITDPDEACRFEAARSALLMGERDAPVRVLSPLALATGPWRLDAIRLLFKCLEPPASHALLKTLASGQKEPGELRALVQAVGAAGDVHYMPWLIQQMADLTTTRLAGESFSLITGLDLAYLDLDQKPPGTLELGPNDDPNDADVAMDEDDSLPWPDAEKVAAWWKAQGRRFTSGVRYFMGEPLTPGHAVSVLKGGFQRQRSAAATYLCLMNRGTALFNTSAPTWRQQRLLALMGG